MNFYSGELTARQPFEPEAEVLPGVKWGRPEWVLSPAYWAALAQTEPVDNRLFRQPDTLAEEVSFCLLGGFGITAEVNCAAFLHLKMNRIFEPRSHPAASDIRALLHEPISVGEKKVRYRFPNQRSSRLANALNVLRSVEPPTESSRELRDYLLRIDGIGPKTASWIVRNWMGADDVAIIDIHIHRAGLFMGLFSEENVLPRDYFEMEARFLDFSEEICVRASVLDALIWCNMRKLGTLDAAVGGMEHGQRRRRRRRNA